MIAKINSYWVRIYFDKYFFKLPGAIINYVIFCYGSVFLIIIFSTEKNILWEVKNIIRKSYMYKKQIHMWHICTEMSSSISTYHIQ